MRQERPKDELSDAHWEKLYRHVELLEAGRFSEAEQLCSEIMEQIGENARNELPFDSDLQEHLLANYYAQAGEWLQAQRIYEQRLARANRDDLLRLAFAYKDLARHHFQAEELNLAAMYMAEAITSVRRHDDDVILLSHWMPFDANIASKQGRYACAVASLDEALSYVEEKRTWDHARSQILISRAYARLKMGDFAAAEADHCEAWERLTPWECMESACGVQSTFADWWLVEAELWESYSEWEQTNHAWQQTLKYRRRTVEIWDEDSLHCLLPLASDLAAYGRYLMRRGDLAAAHESFAESDLIRAAFRLAPLVRQS